MGPVGIIWPDMEAAAVGYLSGALADRDELYARGVWVTAQKESGRARQVTIRDDGGRWLGDVRATVRLGVNVWADNESDATALAALVTALLNAWPDGKPVLRAQATRAYPVADAAGPRRYLTCELVVRGTAL